MGRGERTDGDLDDHVEDGGTNDGTSADISLDIETMSVMMPAGVSICPKSPIFKQSEFLAIKIFDE